MLSRHCKVDKHSTNVVEERINKPFLWDQAQGQTGTVALVTMVTVNFPSESSIVVYRKAYPISRETLAAYSF